MVSNLDKLIDIEDKIKNNFIVEKSFICSGMWLHIDDIRLMIGIFKDGYTLIDGCTNINYEKLNEKQLLETIKDNKILNKRI